MLLWIVPPPWTWGIVGSSDPPDIAIRLSDTSIHPMGVDVSPFTVPANALTTRRDLKPHFYNHNFTVDADDDYRIVILRDMGEAQQLLPTHLPLLPQHDPRDATFFRLHLRVSMTFMLLGGDVSEKYPPHVILAEMEALGVPGMGSDPEGDMAPLSDARWQTDLGRAILADVMRASTELNRYDSDDSDFEDSESDSNGAAPTPSGMDVPACLVGR
ncbi:hypothetical protein B0H13DRAFT_2481304 [Mycena leptocephala]|nr:hypothetical protein B0H13DRAFT_2481304 [Mycena leptocephala]